MTEGNFVDYSKVWIKAGNGGAGSVHFHREKFIDRGGPDGGDGGRGGHVIIRANPQLWTLFHFKFKQHFKAPFGENGRKKRMSGAQGDDVYIDVPVGTIVKNTETEKVLVEVVEPDQEVIIAKGGKGGLGNWHFRSSVRQSPKYAQKGLPGDEMNLTLELKLLADVGFVGFPNVGKSSLLAALTSAKPKIANYEFTTLKPNLGIVEYRDFKSFVIADIPGIIKGASEGKGLGHYFLRHIERNSILIYLISVESKDVKQEFNILKQELQKFNPEIMDKPYLVVLSKNDLLDQELKEEYVKELETHFPNIPSLMVSSATGNGLTELKDLIWEQLNPKE